ncbi:MAG TPA: helix-turn-helix domain-containing protein [Pseudolabrys sp.]|nr:helix-turn-helix domain-containing protein [Pseudolabrys sp.]
MSTARKNGPAARKAAAKSAARSATGTANAAAKDSRAKHPARRKAAREQLNSAVGKAIFSLRRQQGLTASDLAKRAGVSAAMISRIEKGKVLPSLGVVQSLAMAMNVPMSVFFQDTGSTVTDVTHVRKGAGLKSVRQLGAHAHEYVVLGFHRRADLQFESHLITVKRHRKATPPTYVGSGCVTIYVLEGKAIYRHGERRFQISAGDSLSFDAEQCYGIQEVLTPRVRFLSVQAERRK